MANDRWRETIPGLWVLAGPGDAVRATVTRVVAFDEYHWLAYAERGTTGGAEGEKGAAMRAARKALRGAGRGGEDAA